MAKKFHHIKVVAYGTKQEEIGLKEIFAELLLEDIEIFSETIEADYEGGVFLDERVKVYAEISESENMDDFLKKVIKGLDEYDFGDLVENPLKRLDDDCNLYLRLSKDEAKDGKIVFENRDCIHVTVKIAAYPAKKENASYILNEFIEKNRG